MKAYTAAIIAAPLLFVACGGSTPAHDAVQGEATGDYTGISGGDTVPRMQGIGPIDTARPPVDTAPIQPPPPPIQPQP
jgi:hypothetical protein